jgi:hypothetical protein
LTTRNSLQPQHGHHLVPLAVEYLDGAFLVLAGLERQRVRALEGGELLGVDAALAGFADLLPGIGRLRWEVGLAHQESRAVVVGVDEAGGDLLGAGVVEVAGVGVVDVNISCSYSAGRGARWVGGGAMRGANRMGRLVLTLTER